MGMARHVRRGVDEGGAGRSYSGEKGVHHVVKVGGRPEYKDGGRWHPGPCGGEAWKIEALAIRPRHPNHADGKRGTPYSEVNEGSEADESQHSKGPLIPRILFSSHKLLLETLVIKRKGTRKIDDVITDLECGRAGGMFTAASQERHCQGFMPKP